MLVLILWFPLASLIKFSSCHNAFRRYHLTNIGQTFPYKVKNCQRKKCFRPNGANGIKFLRVSL